jgi:adenylate cyclase class 2
MTAGIATYEVELKFPLGAAEPLRSRLLALGAVARDREYHVDRYFHHPCRDFHQTDEALRIRVDGIGVSLTYKGPKIDEATKTRREQQVRFSGGETEAQKLADLLNALGFRQARTIRKHRDLFDLVWEGRRIEIALDNVADLGSFVELESCCSADDVAGTRESVQRLADLLGLVGSERKSYLELLLERSRP